MLSLKDRLLSAFELFFVTFFVSLHERHQIHRALSNEYYVSIFDFLRIVICLNDTTLAETHRFKHVISANGNLSLTLCFKCHNRVVVEAFWKFYVISVSSMRQF